MKSDLSKANLSLHACILKLDFVSEELYFLTHSDVNKMFTESALGLMCLYKERIDEMYCELSDLREEIRER